MCAYIRAHKAAQSAPCHVHTHTQLARTHTNRHAHIRDHLEKPASRHCLSTRYICLCLKVEFLRYGHNFSLKWQMNLHYQQNVKNQQCWCQRLLRTVSCCVVEISTEASPGPSCHVKPLCTSRGAGPITHSISAGRCIQAASLVSQALLAFSLISKQNILTIWQERKYYSYFPY